MNELPELMKQIQLIIQKAARSLNASQRNLKEGDYDFASSRAYYVAFYAMEAALLTKNLSFSKHSAVIGAFNQNFVKPKIFPKEFSKLIARLFRERQIGDYDFDLSISEQDAQKDIEAAEVILKAIQKYLEEKELL